MKRFCKVCVKLYLSTGGVCLRPMLFSRTPPLCSYTHLGAAQCTVGLWSSLVQLEVKYLLQGHMDGSYLSEGA